MSDRRTGAADGSPAVPGREADPAIGTPLLEQVDEAECLALISPGGLGRLAYSGRHDLTVLPVNYMLHEGSIVFRTAQDSPTDEDEDLRTGIHGLPGSDACWSGIPGLSRRSDRDPPLHSAVRHLAADSPNSLRIRAVGSH